MPIDKYLCKINLTFGQREFDENFWIKRKAETYAQDSMM
jgi:hypothetical protein